MSTTLAISVSTTGLPVNSIREFSLCLDRSAEVPVTSTPGVGASSGIGPIAAATLAIASSINSEFYLYQAHLSPDHHTCDQTLTIQ